MWIEIRDWTMWIFELVLVLLVAKSVLLEKETLAWIIKEFEYDESKDIEKKHKRTKTTKRVTTKPGGESMTEETTETSEPMNQGEQK